MLGEISDVLVVFDGTTELLLIDEMPLAERVVAGVGDIARSVVLGEEIGTEV